MTPRRSIGHAGYYVDAPSSRARNIERTPTTIQRFQRPARRRTGREAHVMTPRHEPTPAEEIDPVYGMTLNPSDAAGSTVHEGRTYYFCATGCKTKFDQNPDAYIKG